MDTVKNQLNWSGNTEEFAALCEAWLRIKRIGKSDTQVTVRLVRDYVARGILSRPHPKGKEVIFSYEHLIQFLACRHLLEEGYALKRIADDLQTSSLDVILSWIPGEENDRAMGLINKFKASKPYMEAVLREPSLIVTTTSVTQIMRQVRHHCRHRATMKERDEEPLTRLIMIRNILINILMRCVNLIKISLKSSNRI